MPFGGDYMRFLWTTVLVEKCSGRPAASKTRSFSIPVSSSTPSTLLALATCSRFSLRRETITAGVQAYFARKFATDSDFRTEFSRNQLEETRAAVRKQQGRLTPGGRTLKRFDFLRYAQP